MVKEQYNRKRRSYRADLHTHSAASDGVLPPAEIINRAVNDGLDIVAITDHDTVSGLDEGIKAAEGKIAFVCGVELSVQSPLQMHMLGLGINGYSVIEEELKVLQIKRHERNNRIISILNSLGVCITYDEVLRIARGESVGRAHIAAVMVSKGYCTNVSEAFDKYLFEGKPAYVALNRLSSEDAIRLIRAAGGVPVLAHPFSIALNKNEIDIFVGVLAKCGLGGIECHYFAYTTEEIRSLVGIAKKHNLIITGGSDFHSAEKNSKKRFFISKAIYDLLRYRDFRCSKE